jgi:hypothetical protein
VVFVQLVWSLLLGLIIVLQSDGLQKQRQQVPITTVIWLIKPQQSVQACFNQSEQQEKHSLVLACVIWS